MPDTDWFEYQYNPRKSVLNASAIIEGWRRRSALVLGRMMPMSDLKYGAHPRETLDLFRAPGATATLVFIHGGYWRSLSKLETAFVAEPFVRAGVSVALINYPLCPDVTVSHIRESVLISFAYLCSKVLNKAEQQTIVVSGHSAGGHLAAAHATVNWSTRGLAAAPISAIVSLSGVFDVEPLISTSINNDIRLTPEQARLLNLLAAKPTANVRLLAAVGGDEPEEFHRQSRDLVSNWNIAAPGYSIVPDTNHFTIVEAFADPGHPLHRSVLALLGH